MSQLFRCNISGSLAEFVKTDSIAEQLVSTREYNLSKTVMPIYGIRENWSHAASQCFSKERGQQQSLLSDGGVCCQHACCRIVWQKEVNAD